jgi:hypothetical protein
MLTKLSPPAWRCGVRGAGVWALIPGGSNGTNNLTVLTIASTSIVNTKRRQTGGRRTGAEGALDPSR